MNFTAFERGNFCGIFVDAGDLMAEIGEAGARNEQIIATRIIVAYLMSR